jgi:MFS transporter, ACDE family, multidrug resistance protein
MSRRPPTALIFTISLTGILNNTLVTPAVPDILAEFGVPSDRAGILVSSGAVAGIVLAPIIGLLADRFGRRIVLVACLVAFAAFGGLASLAPTFGILLVARLLQGFGSAGLINLAIVLIGDYWSGTDRTRLVGRNSAVLTVGLASLPLLSGVITEAFGWRITFLVYTVAFATAGWAWLVLDSRRPPDPPAIGRQMRTALAAARHPVPATTMGLAFLVFVSIFGGLLTVLPVHLADEFGLDAAARGFFLSVPAVTSTLAALSVSKIRASMAPAVIVGITATVWVAAFVTLGLAPSLVVIAVGALLFGLGEGSLIPTLQDVNVESAPDDQRGALVAIWVGFARLGQTVGPLLGGVGIALVGTGSTLVAMSAVAGIIAIAGWRGPLRGLGRQTSDAA